MKILIDPDYCWERNLYYQTSVHVMYIYELLKRFFGTEIYNDFRLVVPEAVYYQMDEDKLKNFNPIVIFDNEIKDIFADKYITKSQILEKFYNGDLSEQDLCKLKNLYSEKLAGYEPDVIIQFEYRNKSYDYIFPNALNLTFFGAFFKRGLGPETFIIDPMGSIKDSTLNVFSDKINTFAITDKQNCIVEEFKTNMNKVVADNTPLSAAIEEYRKTFDYLVLLPLQISNHYGFDTEIGFKTQYDYLEYVMDNVPENVGVIVTEHDHARFLEEGRFEHSKGGFLKWFKNKYKNLIYIKELASKSGQYSSSSLYLLPHVDAVINVSSSVALTALLFDKKIISLGKTYNDCFKDSQGPENIIEVLSAPARNKNSLIYWLLTHYIFLEKQLQDTDFMYQNLCKSLEKFKNEGINFEYFEQMNEIGEACDSIVESIRQRFEEAKACEKERRSKLFGIYTEGNHIIIKLLGVKLKFRSTN